MTARSLTKAYGGRWCGGYGLVPGPGHSPHDRSLKVWDDRDGRVFVHSFAGDDWRDCRAYLGLDNEGWSPPSRPRPPPPPARPPARVRDLLRTATAPELVPDVVAYLDSRRLWPLLPGCVLLAHAGAEYWEDGNLIGKFPALLAEIRDCAEALVSLHVTYLEDGRKLSGRPPRKILSATAGHTGCAVRLAPLDGPVLAVGEGIESSLAAGRLLNTPAWAALNTALLANFEPPAGIDKLLICADRDVPGMVAAWKLRDRRSLAMELKLPHGADWAADLEVRR